jgi:transcriptional regulator with XRE-family HTH domain
LNKAEKHEAKLRLAERLKAARVLRKLTQDQVAADLGQHQSYLSKRESGERAITAVELQEFMRLYDLPLEFFWVI